MGAAKRCTSEKLRLDLMVRQVNKDGSWWRQDV